MGGVEPGRLDHHPAGLIEGDAAQLVARFRGGEVLEDQGEVVGLRIHFREPGTGRADPGPGGEGLVEAHLAKVVAELDPRLAAFRALRRKLADEGRRRVRRRMGVVDIEADAVADLACADLACADPVDLCVNPAEAQHLAQPVGVDGLIHADVGKGSARHAGSWCT